MGIELFETSAKDNINVEEMFRAVTKLVLKSKKVSGIILGSLKLITSLFQDQKERLDDPKEQGGRLKLDGRGRPMTKPTKSKCCK